VMEIISLALVNLEFPELARDWAIQSINV
jgi:hypothetical protein